MKKSLLLIALFATSSVCLAQWTDDGTNITTSDNVGIGTSQPNHKLDVNTGGGNFKTYTYGAEHTVNTTRGWARGFRLRNENDDKAAVFGSLNGSAYISTGFDANIDATGYQSQKLTILENGDIGIGTLQPNHKLDVNTGGGNFKTYTHGAEHTVNTTGGWARGFRLRNENDNKAAVFGSLNGSAYISTGFDANIDATGYRSQKLTILENGDIGIGTADTKGFKLGVNGSIAAKEVKVAYYENWSDFVFEEDYALPTLEEVESHINEKGHLKDIPNAAEVAENGIQLGEMNAKLLQKIEELTLYMIEQHKAMKTQEEQNEKQQNEIEELKQMNIKLLEKLE